MSLITFLGNQIPPHMKNTLLYSITEASLLTALASSAVINDSTASGWWFWSGTSSFINVFGRKCVFYKCYDFQGRILVFIIWNSFLKENYRLHRNIHPASQSKANRFFSPFSPELGWWGVIDPTAFKFNQVSNTFRHLKTYSRTTWKPWEAQVPGLQSDQDVL